jgi:hypothetical protein
MHAADRMATDKLKEGIEGFSAALVKLETLLAKRLAELESRAAGNRLIAARQLAKGQPAAAALHVSEAPLPILQSRRRSANKFGLHLL